jgi:hypothetical protein
MMVQNNVCLLNSFFSSIHFRDHKVNS